MHKKLHISKKNAEKGVFSLKNPTSQAWGKVSLSILYYILQYFWTNFNSFFKKILRNTQKIHKRIVEINTVSKYKTLVILRKSAWIFGLPALKEHRKEKPSF